MQEKIVVAGFSILIAFIMGLIAKMVWGYLEGRKEVLHDRRSDDGVKCPHHDNHETRLRCLENHSMDTNNKVSKNETVLTERTRQIFKELEAIKAHGEKTQVQVNNIDKKLDVLIGSLGGVVI